MLRMPARMALPATILATALAIVLAGCTAPSSPGDVASPGASGRPGPSFSPRPTIDPSAEPVTGEVPGAVLDAVKADLSARTGMVATGAMVVRGEAVEWSDGSLGCPEPGMLYTQAIVPGYHVVLALDGMQYDYRVAGEGQTIRLCEALRPAGGG